jgi:TRAP transporter TAXI family solute receptor
VDNPDKLGIVTGSEAGTYIKFGQDMAALTEQYGLSLLVKESEGSLANIRRLISKENAAVGIVQSDVLGFLTRSQDNRMRRVASLLRLIFPFYNEEVHLYAHKDIQSFADLAGKRVVVGTKGSGNWLTTTNLLHMMDVEPAERMNLSPPEGVTAVLTGKADAMIYVAGKPVKLFSNIEQLKNSKKYGDLVKNVHFVPLDDPKMMKEYLPANLTPQDYGWIEQEVATIAVKAVLVSFDFSRKPTPYYERRCRELGVLGAAIRSNLALLRDNGHPKWNEVDLEQDVGLWKADTCSRVEVVRSKLKRSDPDDFLIKELEKCVRTGTCE